MKEFLPYPKIERIGKMFMHITQKIHGTNAQVFIYKDKETDKVELLCGSRTRWITPEDDNYGFAKFVHENKQEFIDKLGLGQHFGEWAGYGINSGEGLEKERIFVLFDFWKYPPEKELPKGCVVVPVLYSGQVDFNKINEIAEDLKLNGSKLSKGFMRPEGIVINISGVRYKKVFEAEESKWKYGDIGYRKDQEDKKNELYVKYGHLLQPIRLEKLLSRDERYILDFPSSMSKIVCDYIDDLVSEKQIEQSESETVKKAFGGFVFKFVRQTIEDKNKLI